MKIPDKIKIGGHWIPVKRIEVTVDDNLDSEGQFNSYYRVIKLRQDHGEIREDTVTEAFQHEIFEAIKHINQLELPHITLTVLSEVFFQVVRDNKLNFSDTETD